MVAPLRRVAGLWMLSLFAGWALAAEVTAGWTIALPAEPDTPEIRAAEELRHYLKRVADLDLAIVRADEPGPGTLVIGSLASSPAVRARAAAFDLGDGGEDVDRLAVTFADGRLWLAGNHPRAALYAVYTFLNEICGVEWLWAGDDGEFVPRRERIALDGVDLRWRAPFKYRGFHLCSTPRANVEPETETWMSRRRLNFMRANRLASDGPDVAALRRAKGFHIMYSDHNFTLAGDWFKRRPELFALRDGRRVADQLCWSHPDIPGLLTDKFVGILADVPEIEILSSFPSDNRNYCQCDACAARPVSEGWFGLMLDVFARVRAVAPQLKFATIAYQGYLTPPENIDLTSLDLMEYCQYDRCFVHRFDQKCSVNNRSLGRLAQWEKTGVPLGIYGYEFDVFIPANQILPLYSLIADQLRHFRDRGYVSVMPEVIPRHNTLKRDAFNHLRLAYHVYADLLNNPDADPGALIEQYCRTAFADAGPAMARYFALLDQAWSSMDLHLSHYGLQNHGIAGKFLNPERIAAVDKLFAEARAAAEGIADAELRDAVDKRLAIETAIFDDWREVYNRDRAADMVVVVPKTAAPGPDASPALTRFVPVKGDKARATRLWLGWDDEAIHVKAILADDEPDKLVAPSTEHDTRLWTTDESLELFFATPEDREKGLYRHLAVNPQGTRYDATDHIGDRDESWNPAWTASTTVEKNGWTVTARLPFADFGTAPDPAQPWTFCAARTSGGREDLAAAVFPDASSWHNWNGFAPLRFTERTEVVAVALYSNPANYPVAEVARIGDTLRDAGFQARATADADAFLAAVPGAAVIAVTHPNPALTEDDFKKTIQPALRDGATVLISSYHGLPLDRYFGDPSLRLRWSGWDIDVDNRRSVEVREGDWLRDPNDLLPILREKQPPASAYRPLEPEGWTVWASVPMKNGEAWPYLLSRRVGKGLLVVTTCDIVGWNTERGIFAGSGPQTVQLFENLAKARK